MGAFSLNVFKTFTADDGGMVITSDKDLYSVLLVFMTKATHPTGQVYRSVTEIFWD